MIHRFPEVGASAIELGVLATEIRVRVLNCSASGCLVESSQPVVVGTVSILRVEFDGEAFEDIVQVVRCQAIDSASAVCHLGVQFVPTVQPSGGMRRYWMRREGSSLTGWFRI